MQSERLDNEGIGTVVMNIIYHNLFRNLAITCDMLPNHNIFLC